MREGREKRERRRKEEEGEEDLFFMWRVEELLDEVCMSGRKDLRQRAFGSRKLG